MLLRLALRTPSQRSAGFPASSARSRFFSSYASSSYAARSSPSNSPVDAVRQGTGSADGQEQAFEAKLNAEPAEAPVKRLSLCDTLWADVEADEGVRRSREEREKLYKEVKELVKPKPTPFGFDLEWSPFVRPGVQGTTALVQICDRGTVLLVHLAQMNNELPDVLRRFIEDEEVVKLGVHINGDVHKLRRDFDIAPRGYVEISDLHQRYGGVGTAGGRLISLQRLVGHYLDMYLPKDDDVRTGRCSRNLSPAQIHYAANDVDASLMVVERAAMAAGRTAEQLAQDLAALAR